MKKLRKSEVGGKANPRKRRNPTKTIWEGKNFGRTEGVKRAGGLSRCGAIGAECCKHARDVQQEGG